MRLQQGQKINATVLSDKRNTHFKWPLTGVLHVTEVSTDNRIITANFYPNGPTGGYGSVCWPEWEPIKSVSAAN